MRTGMGRLWPMSIREGFNRSLGAWGGVRVVFLARGLRSLGVLIINLTGAFVDGHNGARVGNQEVSGGAVW